MTFRARTRNFSLVLIGETERPRRESGMVSLLVHHVQHLNRPNRQPGGSGANPVPLAQFSSWLHPQSAFKLKLIEDWGGLEATLEKARIDEKAQSWDGVEDSIAMLRSFLPPSNRDKTA